MSNWDDIVSSEMVQRRRYEQRRRAEQLTQTRRRIVEATVELHRTIGPAASRISEIARRAGVQRATVYNHFPDDASLFSACSGHWRALHPAPDPAGWLALDDPGGRLRLGLSELYSWYRETEPMTSHVLRDAELLPALARIVESGLGRYLDRAAMVLAEPFRARGRRRQRIEAAATAAVGFHLWRALAALGDEEAAGLAAGLVELAAAGGAAPRLS
jgi:AcrR family transcriptional regulator